jgi:CRISPR/Cas system-associated exonuclease Cas4 (RecB family)
MPVLARRTGDAGGLFTALGGGQSVRLSYSKLNTYRQCPLRYRFTYLDRLPRRPRRLFRASRRIHHALMRWLTYARSGMPRWEDVLTAYNSAWGALQDPSVIDTRDYQEGLDILEQYHAANLERPCQPVLLEHKFAVPLGAHILTGAVDRVDASDSGYEVIDYKLDREIRSQELVDNDLQLGLYQLALEESQGIRPEALTLYFLRHNVQRTTVRSRDQTAELAQWVVSTGTEIGRTREWKPCVADHCASCDFRSICPAHTGRPLPPPTPARVEAQISLLLPSGGEEDALVETGEAPESQLSLPLR